MITKCNYNNPTFQYSIINSLAQVEPTSLHTFLPASGRHHPSRYTPAMRRLYSLSAASSRSRAVVSPGTLCDG